MKTSWNLAQVWNRSLEEKKEKQVKARDHIWASEMGGSFIDRYLKMKGESYTNPPNARSLRKFEAGNIMEWLVGIVLKRAGILIESQEWVKYTYSGLLPVTGRADYIAGGNPDWDKAKEEIQMLGLPEFFDRATNNLIDYFSREYPKGLETVVLEIKSCGSMMYERYEKVNKPNANHRLQLFHYLKAKEMPEGRVIYISKDDLRILEFGIFNPSTVEDEYKQDVRIMTDYYTKQEQPPLESLVIFDKDTGKFSKNWKVEYSNYLTKLYGYEQPMDYAKEWEAKVSQWNRVLTRLVKGDNITVKNILVIDEMKEMYSNFDDMVKTAKLVRLAEPELEENEE